MHILQIPRGGTLGFRWSLWGSVPRGMSGLRGVVASVRVGGYSRPRRGGGLCRKRRPFTRVYVIHRKSPLRGGEGGGRGSGAQSSSGRDIQEKKRKEEEKLPEEALMPSALILCHPLAKRSFPLSPPLQLPILRFSAHGCTSPSPAFPVPSPAPPAT